MDIEHAQTGFFSQPNESFNNGVLSHKMKDINSMTQYYSQNYNETGQDFDNDVKETAPLFSNQNRANTFSGQLDTMVKFERQSTPDSSCGQSVNPVSQNEDRQMFRTKRNETFSNEFEQIPKRSRYGENGCLDKNDENQSCDLIS